MMDGLTEMLQCLSGKGGVRPGGALASLKVLIVPDRSRSSLALFAHNDRPLLLFNLRDGSRHATALLQYSLASKDREKERFELEFGSFRRSNLIKIRL